MSKEIRETLRKFLEKLRSHHASEFEPTFYREGSHVLILGPDEPLDENFASSDESSYISKVAAPTFHGEPNGATRETQLTP